MREDVQAIETFLFLEKRAMPIISTLDSPIS